MTRLFQAPQDAELEAKKRTADLVAEAADLDEESRKLGEAIGKKRPIEAIHYESEHRGKWRIDFAQTGEDYLLQLFPLRPVPYDWPDVIPLFIAILDPIFPRTVDIVYSPPSDLFKEQAFKFYTIRFKQVAKLPAWETAIRKAMDGLFSLDLWQPQKKGA